MSHKFIILNKACGACLEYKRSMVKPSAQVLVRSWEHRISLQGIMSALNIYGDKVSPKLKMCGACVSKIVDCFIMRDNIFQNCSLYEEPINNSAPAYGVAVGGIDSAVGGVDDSYGAAGELNVVDAVGGKIENYFVDAFGGELISVGGVAAVVGNVASVGELISVGGVDDDSGAPGGIDYSVVAVGNNDSHFVGTDSYVDDDGGSIAGRNVRRVVENYFVEYLDANVGQDELMEIDEGEDRDDVSCVSSRDFGKFEKTIDGGFVCSLDGCQRVFSSVTNQARHNRAFHCYVKGAFVCKYDVCTRTFKSTKEAMAHSLIHGKEHPSTQKFKCTSKLICYYYVFF